jgi:nucleoside-diphosphate-sugar epimerase
MRVLVTGGTGFIGSHLVAALQASGHHVRVLVLPGIDAAPLRAGGAEVAVGDVGQPQTLTPAMQDVQGVVHLAAAIGVRLPAADYQAVNVAGTENVCRAALAAGVQRLVHVSSTSVYRHGLGVPVREDDPLEPLADPYPQTKAAADRLVLRMKATDQLPAAIVRTSNVYGPGDSLNFGRIAGRLLAGRAIVIGKGSNHVPFAYVDDVVRGVILVLEHDRAVGQVYHIADDRTPTQEQLLREIAAQLGAGMPRLRVPYRLLYSAAIAAEGVSRLTRSPQALVTRFGIALYGTDNLVAIDKARQELGYEPQVSLSRGVSLAARWYLEQHGQAAQIVGQQATA